MSAREIKKILSEFGAKNEEELTNILNKEWNVAKCSICGKTIDLLLCEYINGDPACKGGCYGQG
jgi:hypothetical protein